MFQSIGWLEIFTLVIVALIVVGPERLPGLIEDVRAAIFAARRAINNAKKELNGELGEEFEQFRKPMEQVAEYTRLGPRGAITKALFDGDDSALDDFDPKKMMEEDPRTPQPQPSQQQARGARLSGPQYPGQPDRDGREGGKGDYGTGGGFSWTDIT
ncbi:twin-arginine translocase subunit TatB [Corynebacterium hylobatis]|uniref:Sec-independent protein translocase protein TatB n=1 Tax=Corynebacterium hylobatis TaxID=1859290 RepID=A0A430I141_9CORY|nr:Sec-independent protein translocase protein TatB [Corynebacterium hylobatis]RSZ65470.1 twin-arginine translocase subunit TatB [Corynebacterium hylobatis]